MQDQGSCLVKNQEEARLFWKAWLRDLESPCLLLFDGDLGAGKTTSLRFILEILGGKALQVASPTFALHHRYSLPESSRFKRVDHFDLYRIESEEELEGTGFWDLLNEGGAALSIVEWGSRVSKESWPLGLLTYQFRFEVQGPETRTIVWEKI